MFSSIGKIFTTPPRQAEHSDTRQDIQRHDPEYERRKKKKQNEPEDLFSEDGATVSVQALRIFLENFLKSLQEQGETTPQNAQHDPEQEEFAWFKANEEAGGQSENKPKSGNAAYAAGAYQHVAAAQQRTSLLEDSGVDGAPLIRLEASEVRTIHAILEDLKNVEKKKIEFIRIERSESFLQSIAAAVEKIKHGPSFSI